MFKLIGLDKLQKELEGAQRALENLDGEFGTVKFDPHDPGSIETAIQSVVRLIDERTGPYTSNPFLATWIEEMKDAYREKILQMAAEARLAGDKDA